MSDEVKKLQLAAVQFLLWQKRCMLFTLEQSDGIMGRPDVFALNKKRETIEIEIKISKSDFMANRKKGTMQYRRMMPERGPNYFYYMMPDALAEKCVNDVEDGFGMIGVYSFSGKGWRVLKSPKKIHANKTSPERIATLIREQSSTMLGLLDKLNRAKGEP